MQLRAPAKQANLCFDSFEPFEATQWSMILKARDSSAPGGAEALENFARTYWPPLYSFIRREGYDRHDAQDLTQEFYHHFREKNLLNRITEPRGRFRTFLLKCLKNFLADQRDRERAQKRGGGQDLISLDALEAEERDVMEPKDGLTPDQVFERRWAETLLDLTLQRLRREYVAEDKGAFLDVIADLQPHKHGSITYTQVGARFGLSEGGVKSAVHRMRRRYRQILEEEVARTVGSNQQVRKEVRYLLEILARRT